MGFAALDRLLGLLNLEREVIGDLVVRVVPQDVENEALLDRLPHRVNVEGRRLVVLGRRGRGIGQATEELQRLGLGRRGEGKEAEVGVGPSRGDGGRNHVVGRQLLFVVLPALDHEHFFQLPGGGAALRGMGLVGDDGVAALLQAHAVLDGAEHEGEGLDGDDDDGLRTLQGLREFLRLRAFALLAVDAADDTVGVLELIDRLLELVVEDGPIGDDDDGVKLFLAPCGVERGELMGGPGDGVGFARAGAVLDEVLVPGALRARRLQQFPHDIPLMVTRKDHRLLLPLPAVPVLLLDDLEVNETGEDVEQVFGQQHLIPKVVRGVPVDVVRHVVARAAVRGAAIEGQEDRLLAGEAGGHGDLVLADGEVDEGAAFEGEQRFGLLSDRVDRQTRGLVLFDGTVGGLLELGLQLQRGHGQAVDEEHEVDTPGLCLRARGGEFGFRRPRAVHDLRHDTQTVLSVASECVGVEIVLRLELAERETSAAVAQLMAQHAEGAEGPHGLVGGVGVDLVELLGDALEELLLGVARVERAKLLPLLGLGVLHEAHDILRVERERAVVADRFAELPTGLEHVLDDVVLKGEFLGRVDHRESLGKAFQVSGRSLALP
jgi:hypothetical protein